VLFSFQRAIAPGSDLAAQMSAVKEVKKIDDDTVDFITDGPAPILPNYLANVAIMSKAWCEAHNTQRAATLKDEESYATRNANGTGPFMLKDRQPMVRTVLVKSPNWWHLKDQPIDIDEVVFSRVENPATRVAALLSGDLDMIYNVPPQDIEHVERKTRRSKSGRFPSCGRCFSGWTRAATNSWNRMSKARTPSRTSECAGRSTRRSTRTRSCRRSCVALPTRRR
jgi:peptide/nickel transport system substrate-binding protein